MFGNSNTTTIINGGKVVQFQGIKTVYPIGERINCFFAIPEVYQPECGDWIGIYPVGWNSIVRDCIVRQMVPVEQFNCGVQQCCQVVFDSIPTIAVGQHYQFVYVTNSGECTILGTSMPFRFTNEPLPTVYGGESYPYTTTTGIYQPMQQPFFVGRMPVVETEIQKLQNEIVNMEQLTQLNGGEIYNTSIYPGKQSWSGSWKTVVGGACQPSMWQPRLGKIEQILREKIRVEQAHRRIEQLCVLAQIKSCERHIVSVQKREPEIRDYLLRAKMQAKIAAFEQRVNQVVQQRYNGSFTTPVEQYVRKFEQLLKEKIQLDVEQRRVVLHKLRLAVRDCERKLRELQSLDQDHIVNFHQMLKGKFEQFGMRLSGFVGEMGPIEYAKHFETVMGPFWMEQEKLVCSLTQAQRELVLLTNEICGKLQELEMDMAGCYTQLRIPRITTQLMFNTHPKLMQIVQLERKIAEQKLKLKLRMLTQAGLVNGQQMLSLNGGRFVEQLTRGIWFTPLIEKLRMIQYHLNKIVRTNNSITGVSTGRVEKKLQFVNQLINTFAQFQTEIPCQSTIFDQVKLRNVLVQLRDLKERECIEIPRFFQQETTFGSISPVVVELFQHLNEIVGEKYGELNQYVQWFQPQFVQLQQQQMPFECMFATLGMQHSSAMLELIEIERKLVEMKGLALATVHYMHLDERLVELEQLTRCFNVTEQSWVGKRERFVEKIRQLKGLINEHVELPFWSTGSFLTVPEHFFQHQQKYERLCQLVGELECHLIELPFLNNMINYPITTTTTGPFDYETIIRPTTTSGRVFGGFGFFPHRFMRLVQEFQLQFPECFAPKCEEIVNWLRRWIVSGCQPQQVRFFGQELLEKLVEFETILCQPECEIACLTTVIFPQSTTGTFKSQRDCLKYLIRQVRELKTHIQLFLNTTTTTNNNTWFPYENTPLTMGGGSIVTPCVEGQLVDMWNKKMWTGVEGNTTVVRGVETTSTSTTVGGQPKPFGNMMRPISIEKIVCGGEDYFPIPTIGSRFGGRFQQFENVVDECDIDDIVELNNNECEEFDFIGGGETVENCLCQIEKHIRGTKYNNTIGGILGEQQPEWLSNDCCPFCTDNVVVNTGIRRF